MPVHEETERNERRRKASVTAWAPFSAHFDIFWRWFGVRVDVGARALRLSRSDHRDGFDQVYKDVKRSQKKSRAGGTTSWTVQ